MEMVGAAGELRIRQSFSSQTSLRWRCSSSAEATRRMSRIVLTATK